MEAAKLGFGTHGYHGTTIDLIAETVGLSKGTEYRMFSSKDDILLAILADWDAALEKEVLELADGGLVRQHLKRYAQACVSLAASNQGLYTVWQEFFRHPDVKGALQIYHIKEKKRIASLIRFGVRYKVSPWWRLGHFCYWYSGRAPYERER